MAYGKMHPVETLKAEESVPKKPSGVTCMSKKGCCCWCCLFVCFLFVCLFFLYQWIYARTLKMVSKTTFFWGGWKGMLFNPWNCDTCLGHNTHCREQNNQNHHNLKRVYLTAQCNTYVSGVKTYKNSCLGMIFSQWKYLFRVHFVSPRMSMHHIHLWIWVAPGHRKLNLLIN